MIKKILAAIILFYCCTNLIEVGHADHLFGFYEEDGFYIIIKIAVWALFATSFGLLISYLLGIGEHWTGYFESRRVTREPDDKYWNG